jgi:hypothetical protein
VSSSKELISARLAEAFRLYSDLVAALPAGALALDLAGLPSNRIGQQLWCVVGARESYARAIAAGTWRGFACGLPSAQTGDPAAVASHLDRTAAEVEAVLADGALAWTDGHERLLVTLLEHEVQHHGQLIRYLYGNGLPIPPSWKERYSLD